ncbi:MAG: hypothetical protein Q4D88_06660 [Anaerococcus sp.]|nr:hypothetical protein [Anaerococcus sp.]
MKVIVCSCARCTAHGNEYLFDAANVVKGDLEYAYSIGELKKLAKVDIEYKNIMKEVENAHKQSPIVKVDDTYIKKASPEVLMEMMFDILEDQVKDKEE